MHRLKISQQRGQSFVQLVRGVASEAGQINSKDLFGTLSRSGAKSLAVHATERFMPDDDCYDKEEYDLRARKNLYYYKYEISKYARQGSVGLRKALELFHDMKSNDRLTPTHDQFSPLIYGCAKAGYTKKAFELYEESLKYTRKPTKSVVTCLLNACAESPFPEYGLKRLDWLRNHLKINYNYVMNQIQYHSAIKAYGKLGQLKQASDLVQEMIENGINPDTDTFKMLLIGCASNKQSGCILALRVYKRLKFYGLKPDTNVYRLLLRCIRDCGMGSPELITQTIGELPAMTSFNQRLKYKRIDKRNPSSRNNFEWVPLITEAGASIKTAIEQPSVQSIDVQKLKLLEQSKDAPLESKLIRFPTNKPLMNLPETPSNNPAQVMNLLSENHLDLIYRIDGIHFDKLQNGPNRMMLFGGIHGYLEIMVENQCKPDSKTFSLLLDNLKQTKVNQIEYFRLAQDYSIKRDLLFYDLLIRHICASYKDKERLDRAFKIIEQMHNDGLRLNISTFESLALGCDNQEQGLKLISDIERAGFVVSLVLIKRLFEVAIYNLDFKYLSTMIKLSREHNTRPTRSLIEEIEEKRIYAQNIIRDYENGTLLPADVPSWLTHEQIKNFDFFNKNLSKWLKNVDVHEEEHPWSQFHLERSAKRTEFTKFVEKFNALNRAKKEALERGEKFGNLMEKSEMLLKQKAMPPPKSEKASQRAP